MHGDKISHRIGYGGIKLIINRFAKIIINILKKRNVWKISSAGYCPCCDSLTAFVFAQDHNDAISEQIKDWELSDQFKCNLLERENYFCIRCFTNFRVRSHAKTILHLTGHSSTEEMIRYMKKNENFVVYETGNYNIFKINKLNKINNYIVSEYYEEIEAGTYVNGMRNENLESLTFSDNSIDLLLNSDVLEHVGNLDNALNEIRRVLKVGGFHVFTVPVDINLPATVERAQIQDGKLIMIKKPEMHGDPFRPDGILAFRDFGCDILEYMSRQGFECSKMDYLINKCFVTSVYFAQKR
jgi:SAM-dependent methyltransferase